MHKQSGMLYIKDIDRQDWTSAFDGATLTQILRRGDKWPRPPLALELTDAQVELPRSLAEFPGFDIGLHERPRYGYSDVWQHIVTPRALRAEASQASLLPQSSSTILGDSPVAYLNSPHMHLAFPVPSTFALGASSSRSFASHPTFTSRAGEHFFRPPVVPFSFMQAPFVFQARLGAPPSAQPLSRTQPWAPGAGNVFTSLPLTGASASTTMSASHPAGFVYSQPTPRLLPPPVGPGAQTTPNQVTRDSMSSGQHSDTFTSWSHPASATGQSPWTESTEVIVDESLLAFGGPSSQGPSTALPPLIDTQIFALMQFEGSPLLHIRALHTALEGMSYLLEDRLPTAERPSQHDLSTAEYLQIAAEIPPDRIIVQNLEEFQRLVTATLTDLYPMFARYAAPRNITVERLLEISHLVVRDPTHILSREPPAPQPPVPSGLLTSAHPLPQPAEVYKTLQLIASKFVEASASTKSPPADTSAAGARAPSTGALNSPGSQLPPTSEPTDSCIQAPPSASATTSGAARP